MWKSAMDRKTFFTAASSNENNQMEKRSALSLVLKRSSTFNFVGRVQREVMKTDIERESNFQRFTWASNTLPRAGKQQTEFVTPTNSQSTLNASQNTIVDTPTPMSMENLCSSTMLNTPPTSPEDTVDNSEVTVTVNQHSNLPVVDEEPNSPNNSLEETVETVAVKEVGSLCSNFEQDCDTLLSTKTAEDDTSAAPSPVDQRTFSVKEEDEEEEEEEEKKSEPKQTECYHKDVVEKTAPKPAGLFLLFCLFFYVFAFLSP